MWTTVCVCVCVRERESTNTRETKKGPTNPRFHTGRCSGSRNPPPPTSTGYTGLALELRGEEAVERPAVGKEELKSMKQDGGKKSEKEGRDWREWEKTEACMGGGPPATAAFSPTQDWDLL